MQRGGSVMFWGCFAASETGYLESVQERKLSRRETHSPVFESVSVLQVIGFPAG